MAATGEGAATSTPETPQQPPPQPPPPQQVVVVERRGNGLGVAGFVCGLLSAIFGLIPFLFFVAFPLSVVGIVFGALGWRRARRDPARGAKGLSLAGLILGVVGLVLAIVQVVLIGEAAEEIDEDLRDFEEELEQLEEDLDNP
jgi:hypothetical protein